MTRIMLIALLIAACDDPWEQSCGKCARKCAPQSVSMCRPTMQPYEQWCVCGASECKR